MLSEVGTRLRAEIENGTVPAVPKREHELGSQVGSQVGTNWPRVNDPIGWRRSSYHDHDITVKNGITGTEHKI
jgi:hypothetical protein